MGFLYEARNDDQEIFGENWCGPDSFEHMKPTLVARYYSTDEDDGQSAEVWCSAYPARFYEVRVMAGVDSCGDPKEPWPFKLTTGSGREMAQLCAQIAEAVATGMLGIRPLLSGGKGRG